MTITVQRIILLAAIAAAIVLAGIVLASSPGTHIAEICWAIIALAVGLLVDRFVP